MHLRLLWFAVATLASRSAKWTDVAGLHDNDGPKLCKAGWLLEKAHGEAQLLATKSRERLVAATVVWRLAEAQREAVALEMNVSRDHGHLAALKTLGEEARGTATEFEAHAANTTEAAIGAASGWTALHEAINTLAGVVTQATTPKSWLMGSHQATKPGNGDTGEKVEAVIEHVCSTGTKTSFLRGIEATPQLVAKLNEQGTGTGYTVIGTGLETNNAGSQASSGGSYCPILNFANGANAPGLLLVGSSNYGKDRLGTYITIAGKSSGGNVAFDKDATTVAAKKKLADIATTISAAHAALSKDTRWCKAPDEKAWASKGHARNHVVAAATNSRRAIANAQREAAAQK
ncbi:hypothetical protein ERJ75_001036900 [Trypanosoma vivax]|uniref:Trypanosome variant surface glycoprotein A-type N-terminal domain-containing protein n=1 Tax=Trypanosoma vivax (strain Y486) TaxID=1055687 RepID=F9WVR8_TRYVY|nr:hypothetical protein ERJ75_001036900 [Trypanosoma vivax]CCD21678.1 hypothetical protein, conserved in T.vivax [Trypanosoma vivax Y486]|eukprot:CCD21678.1 hypothetical protein, conserved in T.vivax [Trypanosoma vivax Y486]